MKQRIWELDAFRGICIIGMLVVHFIYDLTDLYRLVKWDAPELFEFVQEWGGVLFLLISGICVTLGSRSVRRGLIVFSCGLIVSAVTVGMYLLDFSGKSIIIYFGVLHCLGACMILWPVFRKLPWWILAPLGIVLAALGFHFDTIRVDTSWLIPLGLYPWGFASADYFPLLPNLGYFLIGAAIGRTLYRKQETLLPMVNEKNVIVRFLCGCGKHSLWIYLLHQPVFSGLFYLITSVVK